IVNLGSDGLVAVGPKGVQMRVDEIPSSLLGDGNRVAEQIAPPSGDLYQLDTESAEFLVLGPSDALRHDADHAAAELLRAGCRAQCRVSHRRHDQLTDATLLAEVVQEVHRA